jgi:DNA-directed RNA polymerase III subunit RPC6
MVYSLIDEAGRDGIWIRRIKDRCGLHDSTTRAALKFLETKKYITDMKSVEHLNQKMYIKATMAPSEKATGGPWYTDGELDDAFIDIIEAVLYRRIFELSYRKSAAKDTLRKAKKSIGGGERRSSVSKPTSEEARAARDAALNPKIKIEEESSRPSKRRKEATHAERFLHYPADYREYPTLQELTLYVENSSYTTTVLSAEEISQLLDVLCYDKKIEKIRVPGSDKEAYKAVDRSAPYIETDPYKGPSNGLTGVPCGRCPVFDLCEEGGPVAPSNCEYFREWFQN